MFIVDSSGWIEYFTSGPRAAAYQKHLKDPRQVITPAIILYEAFRQRSLASAKVDMKEEKRIKGMKI